MQEQDELDARIHHLLTRLHDHNCDEHQPSVEAAESMAKGSAADPEEPLETYHIYPVPGGIYVTREEDAAEGSVESSLVAEEEPDEPLITPSCSTTRGGVGTEPPLFPLFLLVICLFVGVDMLNSYLLSQYMPTATITILPVTRELTASSTVALVPGNPTAGQLQGRFFAPLTLSQTESAPATGQGYQDARSARGSILFYNGAYSPQSIPAGTIITSAGGIAIVTDQNAAIPAANPPSLGQAAVSAHALHAGQQGNIPSLAIDLPCCLPSVFAKNVAPFAGGQDARDFTVVTGEDIQRVETNLITQLLQSEQAALAARVTPGEALAPPTCTRAVTSDHQMGEEATHVSVTLSETCNAVAYYTEALQKVAAKGLAAKAKKQVGAPFSLIGNVQVNILHAVIASKRQGSATLTIQTVGMYAYQFSLQELSRLKQRLLGMQEQKALRLLSGLPGIQNATINEGEGSQTLPDNLDAIHILILYEAW